MSVPEITPPEPKQGGGCGTVLLILIGLVLLLPGFCSLIFIGLSLQGSGGLRGFEGLWLFTFLIAALGITLIWQAVRRR